MPSNKGTSWETKGALGLPHAYKYYKLTNEKPVNSKMFREVIDKCNTEFARLLVEEGKTLRIPLLSKIQVIKTKKPNEAKLDYDHFNKTGEKRLFENLHSDGYRARVHWYKNLIPIRGVKPYSIKLSRVLTQMMKNEMKKINGHTKYSELNYGKW